MYQSSLPTMPEGVDLSIRATQHVSYNEALNSLLCNRRESTAHTLGSWNPAASAPCPASVLAC